MNIIPIYASAGIIGFESPAQEYYQLLLIMVSLFVTQGVNYYKIGVALLDLMPTKKLLFDLFNQPQSNQKLMQVFDNLNNKYGISSEKNTASMGYEKELSN